MKSIIFPIASLFAASNAQTYIKAAEFRHLDSNLRATDLPEITTDLPEITPYVDVISVGQRGGGGGGRGGGVMSGGGGNMGGGGWGGGRGWGGGG